MAVIIDGKICVPSLKAIGKKESWLMERLSKQGVDFPKTILLATVDAQNTLVIYKRHPNEQSKTYYV